MRAVVVEAPGKAALHDIDPPVAGDGEVIVRSRFAGVCATDVKIYKGLLPSGVVRYPCVPGHEWSGTVVSGDGFAAGERVVCEGIVRCGECARCLAGETNLCERYDQIGFTRGGGFGELVAAPARIVHRIPDALTLEAAALIEPAACVVRAFTRARVQAGERIAVVGIGTLGSIAVLLAVSMGATVVAFGKRPAELDLAASLGAIVEESEADVVFETAGGVEPVVRATQIARRGGRVVVVGTSGEGATLSLPADLLVRKDLEMIGSFSYTAEAWRRALDLAGSGTIDLSKVVGRQYPLEAFAEAFAAVAGGFETGRVLLQH